MLQTTLTPIHGGGRARYAVATCLPHLKAVRQGEILFHDLTKGHDPGILMQTSVLPGLNSIGIWNGTGAQEWRLNTHHNERVEIGFLKPRAWLSP